MKRRTPIVAVSEEQMSGQAVPEPFRRTEITVEREVVSMRFDAESGFQGFCPECGIPMLMITAEAAAVTIGATTRHVYRWIEENRFHVQESRSGGTFLCTASVASHQSKVENPNVLPQIDAGESA